MGECYSEDMLLVPYRGELSERFVDLIWNREVLAILVEEKFTAQPAVSAKTRLGVRIVPGTC